MLIVYNNQPRQYILLTKENLTKISFTYKEKIFNQNNESFNVHN